MRISHSILTTISSVLQAPDSEVLYRLRHVRPFFMVDNVHGALADSQVVEGFMMMDMTATGTGMLVTMGLYHLAIFVFAVLGIAASIKYLRS